jgi:glutathione S-transferase
LELKLAMELGGARSGVAVAFGLLATAGCLWQLARRYHPQQQQRTQKPPRRKLVLISSPRSNFATRVRYVVYKLGLEDCVEIITPLENQGAIGGGATSLPSPSIKDDDSFMRTVKAANAIDKIPVLLLEDETPLAESQIIVEYLCHRFESSEGGDEGKGALLPSDPAERARAQLVARLHDVYMGSHFLPTLFRDNLSEEQASIGLRWIETALDTIEGLHPGGEEFFVGNDVTVADIGLAPTVVYMLVRGDKLKGGSPFASRPRLASWCKRMMAEPTWQRCYAEMDAMSPANNPDGHMFSGRV